MLCYCLPPDALGLGYRWLGGSIIPPQLFVTAAGNAAPSTIEAPAADVPAPRNLTASIVLPSPETTRGISSNQPSVQPSKSAPQANGNVVVLNPVKPPAMPLPSGGTILPQSQPGSSTDRLPVIGREGHTIWVPRAIEGCWAGSGGGRLQYLGGCPNLFTGSSSPIALRWGFRRMGNQPLTQTTAKRAVSGAGIAALGCHRGKRSNDRAARKNKLQDDGLPTRMQWRKGPAPQA